ncbi:hypothetical protein H6A09_01510 [[Clostridium] spiroforme]|nr:hypothetical protein [Thomasclavelia spiroformis]
MKIELTKDQTDLIITALIDKQSDIRNRIKNFSSCETSDDEVINKYKTKYEEEKNKYDILLKYMCVAAAKDDYVLPIVSFSSSIKENGNIHTTAEIDMFGSAFIGITADMSEQEIRDIYEPALNAFKHCTQELVKKIDE